MRVGIVLPTLSDGDAVGNDAQAMARLLRRRGCDVDFFAWNGQTKEPLRRFDELPKALKSPDDVLIYHHSIGCEPAVRAVERLNCRKAVKYHNVTPPAFFAELNPKIAEGCAEGIKQVARLARTSAHIWADSEFNARDVRAVAPEKPVAELPPFHQADALLKAEPDYRAVAGLDDWNTNLLLIGRVVPNKNIPLALRAFAEYRRTYDRDARLVVVGDRPVPNHAAEVDKLAKLLGVDGHTIVTGKVSVAQLKALYLTADVLLVTSQHEGFCVPLVEAMGLRVPVVAVPSAAVPFTAGDAARFADADPQLLAAEIRAVLADPEAREQQVARGWRRYADTFTTAAIEKRFEALFDELIAANPRPTRNLPMIRHSIVAFVFTTSLASAAGPILDPGSAKPDPKADVLWYDISPLGIEGRGWADTKSPFDRLPAKAETIVRQPVWLLGRQSSGLSVRFVTDAPSILARWTVTSKNLDLPHMPATGVSGLDLYARADDGKWRWAGCKPATAEATAAVLAAGLPPGEREYQLYLPLYNGVSSVELGLPKGTDLKMADPYPSGRAKPVVFYGTSIVQGASASRPGMTHVAQLGRRFGVPVVNLGFSGNGTLDVEMAGLLAEIDAAAYVLDCLPNLHGPQVTERAEPFVKRLRAARPDVPILLVEDRTYTNAGFNAALAARNTENRAALKKAFETMTTSGVKGLHYLPGDGLLGTDGEASVDGAHPTDLGFYRLAEAYGAAIGVLLGGNGPVSGGSPNPRPPPTSL